MLRGGERRLPYRRGSSRWGVGGWTCAGIDWAFVRGQPEPVQRLGHGRGDGSRRQRWALDQQHRQVQGACGQQLGLAPFAARVFGHHPLDAVGAQQRQIAFQRVGAALHHHRAALRWHCKPWLDDAQQIPVRGALQERLHVLPPDGQKDAAWRGWQCDQGSVEVGRAMPAVARLGTPRRALQRQQRHASLCAGFDGMAAHLRGKRVGGVDHVRDALLAQIGRQPLGSAEAAYAGGQRLCDRLRGAPGVGERRRHARSGQRVRQLRGFGSAPKQEDVHGG